MIVQLGTLHGVDLAIEYSLAGTSVNGKQHSEVFIDNLKATNSIASGIKAYAIDVYTNGKWERWQETAPVELKQNQTVNVPLQEPDRNYYYENRNADYEEEISIRVYQSYNHLQQDPIYGTLTFTIPHKRAIPYVKQLGFTEDNRPYVDVQYNDGLIGEEVKFDFELVCTVSLKTQYTFKKTLTYTANQYPLNIRYVMEDHGYIPPVFQRHLRFANYVDGEPLDTTGRLLEPEEAFITIPCSGEPPVINKSGRAYIDVYYVNTSSNVKIHHKSPSGYACRKTANGFEFDFPVTIYSVKLDENSRFVANISYKYETFKEEYEPSHEAFFNTTRNMNFSNGLANNVFLGGTSSPNYTSRVWYSYVNNPLYFPDENYIEVGSNDTAVMGLVKIGEYLGIVKQGKTTDTSIYIAYPTTFDDNTAYAVKPTTNGIGACAKYCFNVLGDETLFLSNEGVMAITPRTESGDEVKNRSYFIDGKLLDEPRLSEAYSFVWKGFYLLAVPNKEDNGHVYLLDGNQHNSWGNDKTNLVYECYFWDNVPAKQFARFKDHLWFSDGKKLCRFKTENDKLPYNDDGDAIKAEWSTLLDDDGSSYYYKNLKKKGSMLTLMPSEFGSSCEVFFKVDDGAEQYIGEVNSAETDMPIDFYFNKKLKKYKRLQIIVRNDIREQGFGVAQIVKLYTLGTFSK